MLSFFQCLSAKRPNSIAPFWRSSAQRRLCTHCACSYQQSNRQLQVVTANKSHLASVSELLSGTRDWSSTEEAFAAAVQEGAAYVSTCQGQVRLCSSLSQHSSASAWPPDTTVVAMALPFTGFCTHQRPGVPGVRPLTSPCQKRMSRLYGAGTVPTSMQPAHCTVELHGHEAVIALSASSTTLTLCNTDCSKQLAVIAALVCKAWLPCSKVELSC